MSVQITINGENAAEALLELSGLAGGLLASTSLTPPAGLGTSASSDSSQDETGGEPAKPKNRGGRPKKETAQPAEVPTDDKAQDAADEKAETEAAKPAEPDVTKDDIRAALGDYSKAYGMDVTMEDGPKLMGFPSVSSVPETQDAMRAAIAAIRGAIEANPYGRAKA